jgi:hypothetical protein
MWRHNSFNAGRTCSSTSGYPLRCASETDQEAGILLIAGEKLIAHQRRFFAQSSC